MAQLNITLSQEEIQALLLNDRGEAFKNILQAGLNKNLQAESAEQLKANRMNGQPSAQTAGTAVGNEN